MAIRASVHSLPAPGHAILRLGELDAAPQGLALSIQRPEGPDTHLGDDGWRRTEAWLLPAHVERKGEVLEFHLGPEICDRLAGIATVRLRVKEPDIGVVATTVVAWPAMLTSGAADPSSRLSDEMIHLRGRPAAAPEPEPVPEPVVAPHPEPPPLPPPLPPRPELRASRALDPEPAPAPNRTGWLIAAVVAVVLAGGGYYAYTNHIAPPPADGPIAATPPVPPPTTTTTSPPKKSVREVVGEFLATKPTAEAMLAKARDYTNAGDSAAAFLVLRRAAEGGSAAAQLELGTFYDPLTTPPKGGFTPDAARAADWYERAALAGLPEAQRRLGLLLAKGGPGLGTDPGRARSWLQQAAAQNDAEAKKALEALPR